MIPSGERGDNFAMLTDDLLARELNQLSVQDRNAISEEIHGVLCLTPEEAPEFLERSLSALEISLAKMIIDLPPSASVYNLFHSRNSYVNDRDFRLRFLRSELFYVEKAALRIMKYLDIALAVCGEAVLKRHVRLDDFTKDEMKVVRSGCIQLLPYRDRAGRPILAFVGDVSFSVKTALKPLLYILSVLRDAESQRKGLVIIACPGHASTFSRFCFNDSQEIELLKRFFESSSIRICAIHVYFPDTSSLQKFGPLIVHATCPSLRPRLKYYDASEIQWQHVFPGYGIPAEIIPITDTSNVKRAFLRRWIKLRTLLEGKSKSDDFEHIVEFPGSFDVLYRAGTTTKCHPGNAAFRELIESKMEDGKMISGLSLSMLVEALIEEFFEIRSGRFLQWDNNGYWVVLNDRAQIKEKLAATIRDFNRWKNDKSHVQLLDSNLRAASKGQQDVKRRRTCPDGSSSQVSGPPVSASQTGSDVHYSFCNL